MSLVKKDLQARIEATKFDTFQFKEKRISMRVGLSQDAVGTSMPKENTKTSDWSLAHNALPGAYGHKNPVTGLYGCQALTACKRAGDTKYLSSRVDF